MAGVSLGTQVAYVLLFISLYFEVFMLLAFLRRNRTVAASSAATLTPENAPHVAIIVPCWNEEKTLATTLTSLLTLEYPKDKLEILVVDDGSKDNTLAQARTFESDPRVRVFHKENGGKHTAMNYALARTDADFIGCLDADSIVAPDALAKIIPVFHNERVAAVTPGIHVKAPQNLLQHMQAAEYSLSVFNRFALAALGATFITPGPFSIFRAPIVKELGGWKHAHSTEDMEIAMRIQKAGHLIANAPSAMVLTSTPRTVKALIRQRVRWTYGFLRNFYDYRHMFASKKYGNLSLMVLPIALISIGTGIFFFLRILFNLASEITLSLLRAQQTGIVPTPSLNPDLSINFFYINTSVFIFLVLFSVVFIVALISLGNKIGTGKKHPPIGTPLFILLYCFIVPVWLSIAVYRALFKTGVRWR